METLQYIGNRSAQNVDGVEKVTGRIKYVGDMTAPGMLFAAVLRSPLPHARIAALDVEPAQALPGVVAVITAADFPEHSLYGWPVRDKYVLAHGKVRYVGEAIAAVAAETEAAARAGVAAIRLELEPLPVVSEMTAALAPDAPIIPDRPANLTAGGYGEGNLCDRHILRNGDPAPLLAQCDTLLDETYFLPHQEHAYIETEAALAVPELDGGLTLYANSQSPFILRDTVAAVLGLPAQWVRTIFPPVGGAFGGKDDCVYETAAQAGRLALATGRPVRLVLGRSESMAASYKREAMQVHVRLGAAAGELQAAHVELLADSGAYASMTPMVCWRATMHAAGAYRYRAVHVDAAAVYTNNGYSGAFRGFGNTPATAAIEMAMDELAERLKQDPLEFRLRHCLRTGDRAPAGERLEQEVGLAACLEWVRERSEWTHKRREYSRRDYPAATDETRRGIGVAAYFHGMGLGSEGEDAATSTLAIHTDDRITLTSGLTDYGQGSRTVFTLVAAEVLGVDPQRITMLRPDTHTARDSGPTVASRASIAGGNATRMAAEKLLQQLTFAAADRLKCAPAQLVRHGEAFIGPDGEPLTFAAVTAHARAMGLPLSCEGRWSAPTLDWDFQHGVGRPYVGYSFGAQVAEVEVVLATGKTRIVGLWAAHDAGKVLYPLGALGQMYGGIAQGVGYGLIEDYRYVDGVPQARTLSAYTLPRAGDLPEIEATFIEGTRGHGPFGAKNMAEPTMIGIAPALANAVYHATGKRIRRLPLSLGE